MRNLLLIVFFFVSGSAGAATHVFTGEAIEIPTSGPADPSFIYVEGVEGEVIGITITLNGFSHRYMEETMIAISNPDGMATLLYDGPDCIATNVELIFADGVEDGLDDNCSYNSNIESGAYRPGFSDAEHEFTIPIAPIRPLFHTLADVILPDPSGRWILWSEDFVGGDGGTIESWEITIETADPEDNM